MRNGQDPVAMFERWMAAGARTMDQVTVWIDTMIAVGLLTEDAAPALERAAEAMIGCGDD